MLKPITDHVSLLKKNRRIYIGDSILTTAQLAELVVNDSKCLGCPEAETQKIGEWQLVITQSDWVLRNPQQLNSWIDVFKKLIPLPEAGINAVRHEIYLMAFTSNIFIWNKGKLHLIKGELPSKDTVDMDLGVEKFIVGFSKIC